MTPRERLTRSLACEASRSVATDEQTLCARDPAAFCDRWVWTYDPRTSPAWRPMILWPRQREYIRWLALRLRGAGPATVVKPRDVGASWLGAAFGVWCLLFLDGASIGYSSRKLMYVESGSPDSTFGKVRAILERLPRWLRPAVHSVRTPMPLIRSMDTGTELKGEGGDNVGRGGRCTLYLLDEYAYMDRQADIESAVSEAAGSVVYCSTFGAPTDRFRQLTDTEGVPCFRFSWRDDPRRNDEWLENKRRVTDPVHFRRDVLCDPDASLSGQMFQAEWLDACTAVRLRPVGRVEAGFDPSGEGDAESVLCLRRGPVVLSLGAVTGVHEEARAQEVARATGRAMVYYDDGGGYGASARRVLGARGIAVHGGVSVSDGAPEHCDLAANVRAGMYLELQWRARNTWLRSQGVEVADGDCLQLPVDPLLREQLLSIQMVERPGGRLYVESKKQRAARGLPSPDRADALGYAYVGQVMGQGVVSVGGW